MTNQTLGNDENGVKPSRNDSGQLESGMIRLQVINLPARADRRAQFITWNDRPGVEINFIDATIGAMLDRDDLIMRNLLAPDATGFTTGALGNALSHHKLWLAARSAATPTFICEDDCCLRADFITQATTLIRQISSAWDIIFFGYNTNATVTVQSDDGLKVLLDFDESAKRVSGYYDAFARTQSAAPTLLKCYQAWGTLAYAITPQGAQRLVDLCFPLTTATPISMFGQNRSIKPYTLDGMINLALQRRRIVGYCAFPPLAVSANDVAGSDVVS